MQDIAQRTYVDADWLSARLVVVNVILPNGKLLGLVTQANRKWWREEGDAGAL